MRLGFVHAGYPISLVSLLPREGCSRAFGCRGFAEVRQDEERGGRWKHRGPGHQSSGPRRFPLKGLWLRVLGPYLAVDLLDEGLAILILLLVLADLLELLDREAVELLHDVVYSQVLVVRGLQGTEDGGLKLRLPGGLLSPPQDLLGLLGGLLGYPETLLGHLLGGPLGGPLEGPHALLHVGERREEVPVSPHLLLRESPIPLLLLAYAPREGLGGAHVVLGLLAKSLYGVARPALHELGGLRCWSCKSFTPPANHSWAARAFSSCNLMNLSPSSASPMLRCWAAARFWARAS